MILVIKNCDKKYYCYNNVMAYINYINNQIMDKKFAGGGAIMHAEVRDGMLEKCGHVVPT